MATLKIGDALAAGIDIGLVSSLSQLQQDQDYVVIGQTEGALRATAGVDYHVAFGGRKGSTYGSREQGRYA